MTENEKVEALIRIANEGKIVRILGVGNSMRPLLHGGRDYVYFENKKNYKTGDIVLYISNGIYIMHRIAKITDEGYIMLGDGNQIMEEPISEENIFLKAIGFKRKNVYISVKNPLYRLYSWMWIKFWLYRPVVRSFKAKLNKLFILRKK